MLINYKLVFEYSNVSYAVVNMLTNNNTRTNFNVSIEVIEPENVETPIDEVLPPTEVTDSKEVMLRIETLRKSLNPHLTSLQTWSNTIEAGEKALSEYENGDDMSRKRAGGRIDKLKKDVGITKVVEFMEVEEEREESVEEVLDCATVDDLESFVNDLKDDAEVNAKEFVEVEGEVRDLSFSLTNDT